MPMQPRKRWVIVQRTVYDEVHEDFREMVRQFIAKEVVPHFSDWERTGAPPKEFYSRAGELGILGVQIPEQFGGGDSPASSSTQS
jgi:alkylation response protein AidB-like acyl-CoA dehydrogenase